MLQSVCTAAAAVADLNFCYSCECAKSALQQSKKVRPTFEIVVADDDDDDNDDEQH